jgi:hypothetical protein
MQIDAIENEFLPNIHFLVPFEKWGVDLMKLLPMTK